MRSIANPVSADTLLYGDIPFRTEMLSDVPLMFLQSMKNLPLLLLLGSSLGFASIGATPSPRQDLHYRFDLHDPSHLHVTLEFTTPPSGDDLLLLPSQWAGERDLYRAVSNLRTSSPDATLAPTPNPARWIVHNRRPGRITVAYDLTQDWSGPLKYPLEHRVILGPGLFEFNGNNGLVAPILSANEAVDVTFDFINLPPSQTLITSFGTTPHQHVTGPWSDVRNALFTGGDLKTNILTVAGSPVLLAIHGKWSFSPAQIAPGIGNILETERRLWHDTAIPFYAIVISPYDDSASGGGGGSGFTNIFNLFLADRKTFNTDTASLVAHEAFHHWNPRALGTVEDTAEIAWFGEGFTRFYQDTILERAGIIGQAEYLNRLNATIKDYLASPRLNAPNLELARTQPVAQTGSPSGSNLNLTAASSPAALGALNLAATPGTSSRSPPDPRSDLPANQQPYLRGAMIALWLSHQINQQTGGRHTLTDLMLDLETGRSQPLTTDRILGAAGRFVHPATVAQLRAFVLDGFTVPIDPGSLGDCVNFREKPFWTFDLGFDPASLHRSGIIGGVRKESSAWKAGVRDGEQLDGFSLWNGNAEREVTLTLREFGGRREQLAFYPRGKLLAVPQAEPIPNCAAGPRIPE